MLEKPNQCLKVETESRVSVAFKKPKTEIKQPQFFQCFFNNGVILKIKLYIKYGYVYDSL